MTPKSPSKYFLSSPLGSGDPLCRMPRAQTQNCSMPNIPPTPPGTEKIASLRGLDALPARSCPDALRRRSGPRQERSRLLLLLLLWLSRLRRKRERCPTP
ncbi:hypothetical protein JZ751_013338 [Albula glossodonta]|uniref:Uncharacterized protein n=1 Tax=Albula glossodonta TaxID=121402 RepID=A0A8T2NUR2_9TELE|nr:hypothetical protein JZ751_013338 [Albula glossodonta]